MASLLGASLPLGSFPAHPGPCCWMALSAMALNRTSVRDSCVSALFPQVCSPAVCPWKILVLLLAKSSTWWHTNICSQDLILHPYELPSSQSPVRFIRIQYQNWIFSFLSSFLPMRYNVSPKNMWHASFLLIQGKAWWRQADFILVINRWKCHWSFNIIYRKTHLKFCLFSMAIRPVQTPLCWTNAGSVHVVVS